MPRMIAVVPVSDEDTTALPVRILEPAIAFYLTVLGFSIFRREAAAVELDCDGVRLRLVERREHEPARAGSLAIEVDDLAAMHRQLQTRGGRPGEFGIGDWSGRRHRTFFLREDENGYCFCFYQPLEPEAT